MLRPFYCRFSTLARSTLPLAQNEKLQSYAPNSRERILLQNALKKWSSQQQEIPIIIDGKEHKTGILKEQRRPANHQHIIAKYHEITNELTQKAIDSSLKARKQWERTSWEARCAIFLKAAELLSNKYRYDALALTMLGQGKNVWQAEIDAAAETCDFWRFNTQYLSEIYSQQPSVHSDGVWNRLEYRGLEGFVLAISPFNFTAIGANLVSAPTICGNVALWKPSSAAIASNYLMFNILREAGLPDSIVQFLPSFDGRAVGDVTFKNNGFAGLHFTGSTQVFRHLWKEISSHLDIYRTYPRIVGETGGKNFHLSHPSADVDQVIYQTIRAAFEYSGQKCSACSRLYVPTSLWKKIQEGLVEHTRKIIAKQFKDNVVMDCFVSAVIDEKAFNRISSALEKVKKTESNVAKIIVGGKCESSVGWYIEPTIILTSDPHFFTMKEELFGPVLTVYVYEDNKWTETLDLIDNTATYGLTGSVFSKDIYALQQAYDVLRHAAGNFYINDKCTGAVVGQQPFGGSRASGTNDKAGAINNLYRWMSMRTVKENFTELSHYSYPHQQ